MNSHVRTAQSLAHAVSEVAAIKLVPRPYNRFAPEQTIWWLVPSVEWPAYKFGKIFFEPREERIPGRKPDSMYSGFYVEKGLNPIVGQLYPSTWIMDHDWFWHDFLDLLQAGLPAYQPDTIITIAAGPLRPPERGREHSDELVPSQEESFKASQVFFKVHPGHRIELVDKNLNFSHRDITEYVAGSIADVDTIRRLAFALHELPSSFDWAWIDVYVGTVLMGSSPLSALDFWTQYLRPWQGWLRSAG